MNRDAYNKIAKTWATYRQKSFVSQLVMDFADKISPNGKILDIGCGTGYPLTQYLVERSFKVLGIDIAEQMIEIAQAVPMDGARFQVADLLNFQTDEVFDGVLAWDSFFHLPKQSQAFIYAKVGRLMRAGAYLLFTHGNGDEEKTDDMMGASFYYSCLPLNQVIDLLHDAALEVVYVLEHYVEKDTDRDLVVFAKKK